MNKRDVKINVNYLTRVEGHGNIVVSVKNGKLKTCRLDIIEAPRFFEAMLKGRSIFEAPHVTSRICGICACAHTLASIQAAEDALGISPTEQTLKLRKLLLYYEFLDSHLLHIYFLVAPDLFGAKSFVSLLSAHEKVVRRALRMKRVCNELCDTLAGRHTHPITPVVGGFTKVPSERELEKMLKLLIDMEPDMNATLEVVTGLRFPDFERDTEYVGLVTDEKEYPLISGDIGSTDGKRLPKSKYKDATNEFVVPHSTAKHTRFSRDSYAVGALARFNLNYKNLRPEAKEAAELLGLKPKCINPYFNTWAQLVECVHVLKEAKVLVKSILEEGVDKDQEVVVGVNEKGELPVKAGSGVGAIEAPRGTLFHHYEVDDRGVIRKANCIIPTNQNLNNIERDMEVLVPEILKKSDEEITQALEMLVRAYDPCISCSVHFIRTNFSRK